MKRLLLSAIRFYRRAVSPLFPPRCRYIPTCSQYALEAVEIKIIASGAVPFGIDAVQRKGYYRIDIGSQRRFGPCGEKLAGSDVCDVFGEIHGDIGCGAVRGISQMNGYFFGNRWFSRHSLRLRFIGSAPPFRISGEALIKAEGIVSDARKSVTECVLKRFNQRFPTVFIVKSAAASRLYTGVG